MTRGNEIQILEDEHDLLVEKQRSLGICGDGKQKANVMTEEVRQQWHDLENKKKSIREKIDLLHKD